jgi:hypothetical protein
MYRFVYFTIIFPILAKSLQLQDYFEDFRQFWVQWQ